MWDIISLILDFKKGFWMYWLRQKNENLTFSDKDKNQLNEYVKLEQKYKNKII